MLDLTARHLGGGAFTCSPSPAACEQSRNSSSSATCALLYLGLKWPLQVQFEATALSSSPRILDQSRGERLRSNYVSLSFRS